MAQAQDRLLPNNTTCTRLIALLLQLLQKRIQLLRTVDISYPESIRLPAQYYSVRVRQGSPKKGSPKKPQRGEKRSFIMAET